MDATLKCVLFATFFGFVFADMSRVLTNVTCLEDNLCKSLHGNRSSCVNDMCQCINHHHLNVSGYCIKDRGLNENCESTDQCYWGPEMVDKLECLKGVCLCKTGFVPGPARICVHYFSGSRSVYEFSGILLLAIVIKNVLQ